MDDEPSLVPKAVFTMSPLISWTANIANIFHYFPYEILTPRRRFRDVTTRGTRRALTAHTISTQRFCEPLVLAEARNVFIR